MFLLRHTGRLQERPDRPAWTPTPPHLRRVPGCVCILLNGGEHVLITAVITHSQHKVHGALPARPRCCRCCCCCCCPVLHKRLLLLLRWHRGLLLLLLLLLLLELEAACRACMATCCCGAQWWQWCCLA